MRIPLAEFYPLNLQVFDYLTNQLGLLYLAIKCLLADYLLAKLDQAFGLFASGFHPSPSRSNNCAKAGIGGVPTPQPQ
jgi:hypothetical protein